MKYFNVDNLKIINNLKIVNTDNITKEINLFVTIFSIKIIELTGIEIDSKFLNYNFTITKIKTDSKFDEQLFEKYQNNIIENIIKRNIILPQTNFIQLYRYFYDLNLKFK